MGYAGLVEILSHLVGDRSFNDLTIPFACTAVDLNSYREVYLREGKVIDAASATMAVPGILPPFHAGSALLVDGGVLDPVPVALARILAPGLPVVAVALSPEVESWERVPPTNLLVSAPLPIPLPTPILQGFSRLRFAQALRIFTQSMDISAMMMTELRLKIDRPDVILRPDVYQTGLFELSDPLTLVDAGRRAVDDNLSLLRRESSWRGRIERFFRRVGPVVEPKVLKSQSPSPPPSPDKDPSI
jgi:NTE family protein